MIKSVNNGEQMGTLEGNTVLGENVNICILLIYHLFLLLEMLYL